MFGCSWLLITFSTVSCKSLIRLLSSVETFTASVSTPAIFSASALFLLAWLSFNDLAQAVRELNAKLNIPACFKECDEVDFDESKFRDVLSRMSTNAHADPCTLTNPGKPTVEDVKALYTAAYYGTAI